MEQAGLRWKEAVRQLANCEVKMPYDALVEKVHVEEGEWISPGSVMFELADVSKLEVSVPLRTSEVEAWLDIEKKSGWYAVTKHKMAQLRWVDGDVTGEGRVLRIEPDSGSHRMLKVVVGIDADEGLRPGMFVSAEIGGKVVHEAFVVPTSALLHNGSLQEVRLENSQYRVTTIPVTWLRRTETYALATESLKQGMLILKRPEPHLADGSVVNLTGR